MISQPVVRSIPLALIDADDRLRPVDKERARAISESMWVSGQLQAVVVRPVGGRFQLVIGGHRHAAAQILRWTDINATVEEMTDLEARLAEIDENLYRHELSALDRAVFLSERKRVWEEMNPETAHGGDRKSLKKQGRNQVAIVATRFTSEAAEKLNISERSIRRACMVAAALSPQVVALVRRTYLAGHASDLEKLARLTPEKQIVAVERLASGEVKTLAGAFGRTERNQDDRLVESFQGLWNRAPAFVKRRMLQFIGVSPTEIERIVNPRSLKLLAAAE